MKAGEDVFAGGDIARFPLPLTGDSANIGHWQLAHKHGRVAAKNMLGKNQPYDSIPFFWTVLYGKSIRYCGEHQQTDRHTHLQTEFMTDTVIRSTHAQTGTHKDRTSAIVVGYICCVC